MSRGLATQQPSKPSEMQPAGSSKGIGEFLSERRDSIAEVVPQSIPGFTAERAIKLAVMAMHKTPKLLECTKASILAAIVDATSIGLEIGGPLAEAYLIPYGKECQLSIDYKGLLKLARRSQEFNVIEARCVFEKDRFQMAYNPTTTIRHEPCLDGDAGPMKQVYCYAVLKTGIVVSEIMNRADVEKVRAISLMSNGPAWRNWYDQMALKAVIRRFLKRQARSIEVATAIEIDEREYDPERPLNVQNGPRRGTAGLSSMLGLGIEEKAFPPQPSVIYTEADDVQDVPAIEADEPGTRG